MGNPGESYPDMIRDLIYEQIQRNYDAIEEACARMLLQIDTNYGVHVQDNPDGTVTATLTPEVPFGEIHYRQTIQGITYKTGEGE